MSVQAITCAMALRGVSPSEKLLLLALANYADENMRCYPSQKRLAEDTCLSDRTVRSLLAGLAERRMISRTERQRQDGSRASDIVTLHFAGSVDANGVTPISGGGETISGGARKQFPGGGEMASGLTTFEPSLNQEGSEEPSPKTRASKRCPQDWLPKTGTVQTLAHEGYFPGDLERALAMVKDHEFPRGHTDWDAVFRNWVRRDRPKPRQANERPHSDQKFIARHENYAAAQRGADIASRKRALAE